MSCPINIGPVRVQDYSNDHWHVSLTINDLDYLGRWYSKTWRTAQINGHHIKNEIGSPDCINAAKAYIKEMKHEYAQEKAGHSISWDFDNRVPIAEMLREAAEKLKAKLKKGIVVLASVSPNKALLVAASTQESLSADKIIREVSRLAGGSGGGRWDFAQGGTSQSSKVSPALEKLPLIVSQLLHKNR